MVFLCFRSKKATKDETLTESKSKVSGENGKKSNIKTGGKPTREPQGRKDIPVKLAPRTTLLKTPKQVVGARIAQALHNKQNPDLENMQFEIKRHSRSPSPPRISNSHTNNTTEDQNKILETEPEQIISKPTSPKLRMSTTMLSSNGVPTSELMEALARRAARQADKME